MSLPNNRQRGIFLAALGAGVLIPNPEEQAVTLADHKSTSFLLAWLRPDEDA